MYPMTASGAGGRKPMKAPRTPAWLRLLREPLSAGERQVLAARHGTLTSAADVATLLRDRALAEEVECLYVIALNAKVRAISVEEVARGSVLATIIRPRELLRLAVVLGASTKRPRRF
jgi:DNA repair protein RadC